MPESTVPLVTAEQARALLEAATPAPWINALQEVVAITTGLSICDVYPVVHDGRSHQPDADLIAAAPDLAATVVALHARLAEHERMAGLTGDGCVPAAAYNDLAARLEAAEARERRVREWADDQARPFADGVPDREGEAVREALLRILDREGNQ